ncbi:hypothetical protein M3Y94_00852800 [Aphelenchoides besseyi]|nr:hypothetical protein M3Y94_00852800 [Aphelenchoides besseyi]KAI6226814.1 7TM GPCR domain containing protein [Aphelenchoides besseyi]
MVLPDPKNCSHAQIVSGDLYINLAIALQMITSIATFIPLAYVTQHSASLRRLNSMAHPNLKLVFMSGLFFVILHVLGILVFKTYSIIHTLTSVSACDFQWSTRSCLAFKIPIYWSVFGFSCCHLVLFIERTLATFCYKMYCGFGQKPGIVLLALTFMIAAVVVYFVYRSEDLTLQRSYCTSTSAKTTHILGDFMFAMTLVDLCVTTGDFVIWLVNRAQLKRRFRRTENYSLERAARLRENHLSIRVVTPLSVIHSFFFLTLFALILLNRNRSAALQPSGHIFALEINHWLICLYVLSSPCNLLVLLKTLDEEPEWLKQTTVNPMDVHFQQLDAQLNPNFNRRESLLGIRMQKLSTSIRSPFSP